MTTPPSPSSDPVAQAAAHWCMRLHEPDCSDAERAEFQQWLESDPRHAAKYAEVENIWTLSAHLLEARPTPRTSGRRPPLPRPPAQAVRRRRSWRKQLRAAALALLVLPPAGYLGWLQGWVPDSYHRYQADATLRKVVLPDGSEVELNLNTHLTYANFRDVRQVVLDQGEAYFHVSHDASHPFVVRAAKGTITVTGTRFDVWKYQDQVTVTVTEGSVRVRSGKDGNDSSLTPGMQASYRAGMLQPLVASADPAQVLAWRDGRLVLDDLSLAAALPLINRYLDAPLVLADQAVANLRIGGTYRTRNLQELVNALPRVLPVELQRQDNGSIRISSRYAQL
ncbi:FecR family protein [Pseudomonas delhiensis]|uniref:FecR family protein n=1 Tax=Pseudomonas delhiensis TaxID=366289 RepID=UPI00315A99A1